MIKIDQDGPYHVVERQDFVARFLIGDDDPNATENADVHVTLADGTKRYITFLTLAEIGRILARWKHSGEVGNGSYFWCSDLVIVPQQGIPAMTTAIEELVHSQDIVSACQLISSGDDDQDFLTDAELDQIEDRAQRATPGPWTPKLETREGIGGASYIELDPGADNDAELYLTYSPVDRISPNAAMDADLDFIAHARTDVPRLAAEVRRLRTTPSKPTRSGTGSPQETRHSDSSNT
jgi:hypothetical protein